MGGDGEKVANTGSAENHEDGSLNPGTPPLPTEFRGCLLEAVDYGLNILGEVVRQAIYERIQKDHGLARAEIPEQLETFHKALESIFGRSARTLERLIAKNLYQKFDLNFTPYPDWTLVEYVNHAKTTSTSGPFHK
jgi:hypothetical protein